MAGNAGNLRFGVDFDVNTANLKKLQQSLQSLRNTRVDDLVRINGSTVADATAQLNRIREGAANIGAALKDSFDSTTQTYNLSKFQSSMKGAYTTATSLSAIMKRIQTDFAAAGATGQQAFTNLVTTMTSVTLQAKQTTTLMTRLKNTIFNTLTYNISATVFNGMISSVRKAISYIEQLDESLNNIQIVTGMTTDKMNEFAVAANKAAKELGASTTSYTNAALIYYQQGLSSDVVKVLTDITTKVANVTKQSAQAVSQELTAVWNGYKVSAQQAEQYVDKMAAVAANSASSLSEIATAMSKVASTANSLGVNVDQLTAQISTIIATTRQAPQSVGTALKTIYARMSSIKAGADDAEISLGNYNAKMAQMGVSVLDASGRLRDMGQVIEEIGSKWSTFSRQQQISLAQTMAGTRQYNNLIALFDGWDKYQQVLSVSTNSLGELDKQNTVYMTSIEAHQKQLTAAWQQLYSTLLNKDVLIGFADGMKSIVQGLTKFLSGIGGLKQVLANLAPLLLSMISDKLITQISTVKNNINQMQISAMKLASQKQMITFFNSLGNESDKVSKKVLAMQGQLNSLGKFIKPEQFNAATKAIKAYTDAVGQRRNLEAAIKKYETLQQRFTKLQQAASGTIKDDSLQDFISRLPLAYQQAQNAASNFVKTLQDSTKIDFSNTQSGLKSIREEFQNFLQSMTGMSQKAVKDPDKMNTFLQNLGLTDQAVDRAKAIIQRINDLTTWKGKGGPTAQQATQIKLQVQQLTGELNGILKAGHAQTENLLSALATGSIQQVKQALILMGESEEEAQKKAKKLINSLQFEGVARQISAAATTFGTLFNSANSLINLIKNGKADFASIVGLVPMLGIGIANIIRLIRSSDTKITGWFTLILSVVAAVVAGVQAIFEGQKQKTQELYKQTRKIKQEQLQQAKAAYQAAKANEQLFKAFNKGYGQYLKNNDKVDDLKTSLDDLTKTYQNQIKITDILSGNYQRMAQAAIALNISQSKKTFEKASGYHQSVMSDISTTGKTSTIYNYGTDDKGFAFFDFFGSKSPNEGVTADHFSVGNSDLHAIQAFAKDHPQFFDQYYYGGLEGDSDDPAYFYMNSGSLIKNGSIASRLQQYYRIRGFRFAKGTSFTRQYQGLLALRDYLVNEQQTYGQAYKDIVQFIDDYKDLYDKLKQSQDAFKQSGLQYGVLNAMSQGNVIPQLNNTVSKTYNAIKDIFIPMFNKTKTFLEDQGIWASDEEIWSQIYNQLGQYEIFNEQINIMKLINETLDKVSPQYRDSIQEVLGNLSYEALVYVTTTFKIDEYTTQQQIQQMISYYEGLEIKIPITAALTFKKQLLQKGTLSDQTIQLLASAPGGSQILEKYNQYKGYLSTKQLIQLLDEDIIGLFSNGTEEDNYWSRNFSQTAIKDRNQKQIQIYQGLQNNLHTKMATLYGLSVGDDGKLTTIPDRGKNSLLGNYTQWDSQSGSITISNWLPVKTPKQLIRNYALFNSPALLSTTGFTSLPDEQSSITIKSDTLKNFPTLESAIKGLKADGLITTSKDANTGDITVTINSQQTPQSRLSKYAYTQNQQNDGDSRPVGLTKRYAKMLYGDAYTSQQYNDAQNRLISQGILVRPVGTTDNSSLLVDYEKILTLPEQIALQLSANSQEMETLQANRISTQDKQQVKALLQYAFIDNNDIFGYHRERQLAMAAAQWDESQSLIDVFDSTIGTFVDSVKKKYNVSDDQWGRILNSYYQSGNANRSFYDSELLAMQEIWARNEQDMGIILSKYDSIYDRTSQDFIDSWNNIVEARRQTLKLTADDLRTYYDYAALMNKEIGAGENRNYENQAWMYNVATMAQQYKTIDQLVMARQAEKISEDQYKNLQYIIGYNSATASGFEGSINDYMQAYGQMFINGQTEGNKYYGAIQQLMSKYNYTQQQATSILLQQVYAAQKTYKSIEDLDKALQSGKISQTIYDAVKEGLIEGQKTLTKKDLQSNYSTVQSAVKDITQGTTISADVYEKLGPKGQAFFTELFDGTYMFIGQAEQFKQVMHQYWQQQSALLQQQQQQQQSRKQKRQGIISRLEDQLSQSENNPEGETLSLIPDKETLQALLGREITAQEYGALLGQGYLTQGFDATLAVGMQIADTESQILSAVKALPSQIGLQLLRANKQDWGGILAQGVNSGAITTQTVEGLIANGILQPEDVIEMVENGALPSYYEDLYAQGVDAISWAMGLIELIGDETSTIDPGTVAKDSSNEAFKEAVSTIPGLVNIIKNIPAEKITPFMGAISEAEILPQIIANPAEIDWSKFQNQVINGKGEFPQDSAATLLATTNFDSESAVLTATETAIFDAPLGGNVWDYLVGAFKNVAGPLWSDLFENKTPLQVLWGAIRGVSPYYTQEWSTDAAVRAADEGLVTIETIAPTLADFQEWLNAIKGSGSTDIDYYTQENKQKLLNSELFNTPLGKYIYDNWGSDEVKSIIDYALSGTQQSLLSWILKNGDPTWDMAALPDVNPLWSGYIENMPQYESALEESTRYYNYLGEEDFNPNSEGAKDFIETAAKDSGYEYVLPNWYMQLLTIHPKSRLQTLQDLIENGTVGYAQLAILDQTGMFGEKGALSNYFQSDVSNFKWGYWRPGSSYTEEDGTEVIDYVLVQSDMFGNGLFDKRDNDAQQPQETSKSDHLTKYTSKTTILDNPNAKIIAMGAHSDLGMGGTGTTQPQPGITEPTVEMPKNQGQVQEPASNQDQQQTPSDIEDLTDSSVSDAADDLSNAADQTNTAVFNLLSTNKEILDKVVDKINKNKPKDQQVNALDALQMLSQLSGEIVDGNTLNSSSVPAGTEQYLDALVDLGYLKKVDDLTYTFTQSGIAAMTSMGLTPGQKLSDSDINLTMQDYNYQQLKTDTPTLGLAITEGKVDQFAKIYSQKVKNGESFEGSQTFYNDVTALLIQSAQRAVLQNTPYSFAKDIEALRAAQISLNDEQIALQSQMIAKTLYGTDADTYAAVAAMVPKKEQLDAVTLAQATLMQLQFDKYQKELASATSDVDILLNKQSHSMTDVAESTEKLRKILVGLLNVSENVANELMQNKQALELIQKAAKGDSKALNDLQKMAAKLDFKDLSNKDLDITATIEYETDTGKATSTVEQLMAQLGDLTAQGTFDVNTDEVGIKANAVFKELVRQAYNATHDVSKAIEIAQSAMDDMGFSGDAMQFQAVTVTAEESAKYGGVGQYVDPITGQVKEVPTEGFDEGTESRTILIPKGSKINHTKEKVGDGDKKGGGGGSGKKAKKHEVKRVDIFHDVNHEIADLTADLTMLQKAQDKLMGNDLTKNLQEQLKIIEKQTQAYKEKLDIARRGIEADKEQLQGLYTAQGITASVGYAGKEVKDILKTALEWREILPQLIYDEDGHITADSYNSWVLKAYELLNQLDQQDDLYSYMKDWISTQTTIMTELQGYADTWYETLQKVQENLYKEIETQVKTFKVNIEASIDLKKAEEKWNTFKRKILLGYDDKNLFGASLESYNNLMDYFNDNVLSSALGTLTEVYDEAAAYIADPENYAGKYFASTVLQDGTIVKAIDTKTMFQDLQKYYEQVIDDLQDIDKIETTINENFTKQLKQVNTAYDNVVKNLESIDKLMNHNIKMAQLLNVDGASAGFAEMAASYAKISENDINIVASRQQQAAKMYEMLKYVADEYGEGSEQWEEAQSDYIGAVESMNDALQTALQSIVGQYQNAISQIFAKWDEGLVGVGGLEMLNKQWELFAKNTEMYLDEVNSANGLKSLEIAFNNALEDNSGNVKAQRAINKLMKEQLKYLEQKDKLSEYQLERAQKLLQLELARIALEDARENRTTMRLRRDSQGNYTYQFVLDEEAQAEAQEEYLNLQTELWNFDKARAEESIQGAVDGYSSFMADLEQGYNKYYNDPQMLQRYVDDLMTKYSTYFGSNYDNLQQALDNMRQDWVNQGYDLQDLDFSNYWNGKTLELIERIAEGGGLESILDSIKQQALQNIRIMEAQRAQAQEAAKVDFDQLSTLQTIADYNRLTIDTQLETLEQIMTLISFLKQVLGANDGILQQARRQVSQAHDLVVLQSRANTLAESNNDDITVLQHILDAQSQMTTGSVWDIDKDTAHQTVQRLITDAGAFVSGNRGMIYDLLDNFIELGPEMFTQAILDDRFDDYFNSVDSIVKQIEGNTININADFPGVNSAKAIEDALKNLLSIAQQRANSTIR